MAVPALLRVMLIVDALVSRPLVPVIFPVREADPVLWNLALERLGSVIRPNRR